MSLINDALKKAQKQRTGEAPSLGSLPSVGGQSAHQISPRDKSFGPNLALIGGGIAAAVILIGAGAFFAFSGKSESGAPIPLPADAKQSAGQTPGSPQGTTAQVSSPAPTTPPAYALPVAPKTEPVPVVAKIETVPAIVAQTAGQTPGSQQQTTLPRPTTPSAQPAPAAPSAKLSPHAIEFIDNIKVAGIRASASDPKVLMNDRVYRPGSMVSADMGLKLVGITADSLTFEDERGGRYTRTF